MTLVVGYLVVLSEDTLLSDVGQEDPMNLYRIG